MNKILFAVIFAASFAASTLSLNAQDILVRKGGEIENVRVLEVTPTEVKYKKSDNEDGPVFIEKRSNLYSVRYMNGELQTFNDKKETSSYYSLFGKEKKFTHELDLFVGTGWGIGYQLRREFNPYVGWNIFGFSYFATEYDPTSCGKMNFKLLGVRGNTPSYKWFRGYADLNLGYSLDYEPHSRRYHSFSLESCLGIQVHKNFSFGCNFIFCSNSNASWFLGAKLSYHF